MSRTAMLITSCHFMVLYNTIDVAIRYVNATSDRFQLYLNSVNTTSVWSTLSPADRLQKHDANLVRRQKM